VSTLTSTSVSRETSVSDADAVSRETHPGPFARLILLPVRGYRRFLSPAISPRCRYYPSCSAYAEQSIRELGAVRGTILAAWRVLRCNPFSKGGVDHVSDRRLFRACDEGHDHSTEARPV
jgi:putative membrane protein insertion efficiency factor